METFIRSLGAYAAHCVDSVRDAYPALAASTDLLRSAALLVHAVHAADSDSGSDDNYDSMLSAAAAIAATTTATVHDIGTVHAERADHAWFGSLPMEPTAVVSRVADAWTAATTATVVTKRTKRGTSRKVVRYGRSFADGSSDTVGTARPAPYPLDGELARVHRGPLGADGVALARIASSAFGVELIGGEFKSWSEVLPAGVSARLGAEPYNYAAHTTGPYRQTNERQLPAYRTAYRTTMRQRDTDHEAWNVTPHAPTARRTVVPAVIVRDDSGKVIDRQRERVAVRSAPTDRYFVGHAVHHRAPAKRDTRARKARSYDEAFTLPAGIDPLEAIGHAAAALERERSATFTNEAGTIAGTLTRGKAGRYAATINGSDVTAKGCRTIDALRRQLAPALLTR
jgi:hypothetical protein